MARRQHRSAGRRGKNYVWTAVRMGAALSTVVSVNRLVEDSDWDTSAGQASGTIVAIRGYLCLRAIGVNDATANWYIGITDDDITSFPSPDTIATYTDSDIMYTSGIGSAAGALSDGYIHFEVIDIKAKRKIKAGTDLVLVMRASANSQIQVSGIIRTLILKNSG